VVEAARHCPALAFLVRLRQRLAVVETGCGAGVPGHAFPVAPSLQAAR
jgi:hypothetical protein